MSSHFIKFCYNNEDVVEDFNSMSLLRENKIKEKTKVKTKKR